MITRSEMVFQSSVFPNSQMLTLGFFAWKTILYFSFKTIDPNKPRSHTLMLHTFSANQSVYFMKIIYKMPSFSPGHHGCIEG